MGALIQEMSIQDYDEVRALWQESEGIELSEVDSRKDIARFLERNPGLSFVARENELIVGAVLCSHDGRRGYIDQLAVRKSHRRQGIGKGLVDRCLYNLMRSGIHRWHLFVRITCPRLSQRMDGYHSPFPAKCVLFVPDSRACAWVSVGE